VRRTFEVKDSKIHGIDELPQPVLVLAILFFFFTAIMHLLILFNGISPAFGVFLHGLPGIVMIDITIVCLLCLTWGILRRWTWAWWGATFLWGLFTLSLIITWLSTGYPQRLSGLAFPAREVEMLDVIPLQGFHLAVFTGIPCLITWIVVVSSRRYFHRSII
jgi:hypothetical protein